MTKETKSGSRTLLMSVLMSSPGPIVVGLGLLVGQSSTQLADFVRRSAELLAIIMAFVVYQMTNREGKPTDPGEKARLERLSNLFVGTVMCVSGLSMLLIALFCLRTEKGNVIPGLTIAVLGVVANTIFWRKYTRLYNETKNAIIGTQARLYRAKSLVDTCVTAALLAVTIAPASPVSLWLDKLGSGIVALYLMWCGIKTVYENK